VRREPERGLHGRLCVARFGDGHKDVVVHGWPVCRTVGGAGAAHGAAPWAALLLH
jgi:hypothetical protein